MSRASVSAFEASYENLLAELFELDIDSTKTDVPTGAILAQKFSANNQQNSHYWLRAVPVNLVPDRDRLLLYKAEKELNISSEDFKRQITDELLNSFDDLFAEIIVDDESGWLIRLKDPARITTYTLNEVNGKNIGSFLPVGDQASKWIAVYNEIQMILHAAGSTEYGFNTLWFEGVGSLPEFRSTLKVGSIGNENLFKAISEYCQAEQYDDFSEIKDRSEGVEKLIVSDTTIFNAINDQSEEFVKQSMQEADRQFSQILSLLDEGRLSQIHLYPLNGNRYSIGKPGMLDFLKRRKKLSELFETKNLV